MTQDDLKNRDYYLLIDRSGSMADAIKAGSNVTRWKAAEEATVALARKCMEYDNDGISVVSFANNFKKYENVDGGDAIIKSIFHDNGPNGGTDTAGALSLVLDDYWKRKAANAAETKPLILFIITDGIPNDEDALVKVIKDAATKVASDDEIRINFVQVGDDEHAHEFLVRLDTGLNAARDIVNCKNMLELENYPTLAEGVLAMVNDLAEATV